MNWLGIASVLLLATPPPADDVPAVTVEADLTQLFAEKLQPERPLRPGVLRLQRAGQPVDVPVELRTRGRSRQWKCRFPPLELAFGAPAPELLGEATRAHLLTHCDAPARAWTGARMDERILREFLGYRYFAASGAPSLGARLVRVKWHDTGRAALRQTRLALFIEDFGDFGRRTGLQPIEGARPPFDPESLARFNVYQLFVHNRDFDLRTDLRNALMLRDPATDRTVLVPFDFDMGRITWGGQFKPASWLKSEICRPAFWRERSELPESAVQRAALEKMRADLGTLAALTLQYSALLPEPAARAVRDHLGAFRRLLDGPKGDGAGVDTVMRACFGLEIAPREEPSKL